MSSDFWKIHFTAHSWMMPSKEMCLLWEDESGRTRGRGLVNSDAPGLEQKHHLKTVLSSLNHRVKLKRKPKFPEGN